MLCVRHARKRHTEPQAFARVLNLRSWPLRLHCREGKGKRKRKKNTARKFLGSAGIIFFKRTQISKAWL